ncbi:Rid family detoxifying hydrolase [Aquimarina agarivorans]|uniref:Rid family detoxifying hydrolase n=1 Tax=Aquimarina agarivorans TaxID=980584 RepID=UPI000248EFD5|nr:Rid family detoxifying hydrolase [Aquimarina agarivorans]
MKEIINTKNAPAPIGPYNQAVLANDTLYISGQIAINPTTGNLITDAITLETKQVFENLKAILAEANFTFENIVKTSIFLSSMEYFATVNEVYSTYFSNDSAPARETVAVNSLPKGVNVEISAIAVRS